MNRNFLPHLLSCTLGILSVILFRGPLSEWVSLSLTDQRYTHLVVIPVISAAFLFIERRRVFTRAAFCPAVGLPLMAAALLAYGILRTGRIHLPADCSLSALALPIVAAWLAIFVICYGTRAFRAAMFPLLFLVLMVPVPFHLMDRIIAVLQRGSAEATSGLFRIAGVPMFREGVRFDLPGIGIEIAAECSSIHSAWALFITGLVLAHIFLKSLWTKTLLSVLTVPIAMATNAVRIVTLWFLGTHVNPVFLFGPLHHKGGILFSLVSLSILGACLWALRKMDSPHSLPPAPAARASALS